MLTVDDVLSKERQFAIEHKPVGMPLNFYRQCVDFPEKMTGLRMLDICSGVANGVQWCRDKGALAYGIDARYGNLLQLERDTDEGVEYCKQESLDYMSMSEWEQSASMIETTRGMFRDDLRLRQQNVLPTTYAAALAGQLPFADNSMDFIYSVNGITGQVDDAALQKQLIGEALRVLKPSGELQLFPYFGEDPRFAFCQMHRGVIEQLNVAYDVVFVSCMLRDRIHIHKR